MRIPAIIVRKGVPKLASVRSKPYNKCLAFLLVNYHLISILPIFCKLLVSLIWLNIPFHTVFSRIKSTDRFSRSTTDVITVITEFVFQTLDKSVEAPTSLQTQGVLFPLKNIGLN